MGIESSSKYGENGSVDTPEIGGATSENQGGSSNCHGIGTLGSGCGWIEKFFGDGLSNRPRAKPRGDQR
jgi:hypothetical protein